MSFSMQKQLNIGAEGLERVSLYLLKRFKNLIDYSDDAERQKRGLDLEVKPWGTVEVKTDLHTTNNFFFEISCGKKPSGIMTSEAKWWLYYFPQLKLVYFLPTLALREYVSKNIKWLKARYKNTIRSHAGNRSWKAEGLVLPRDFVCAAVPVVVYEIYKKKLWHIAGREPEKKRENE